MEKGAGGGGILLKVNGHRRPVPGAPRGTPRESQAKFSDGTVLGL